jgi:mono/diheme cytochrome c family protein
VTQAAARTPGADVQQTAAVDYQQQVHPILATRCLSCHSSERRAGGLSLATYGDALQGGRSGAAVEPGSADSSMLIRRITGDVSPRMPLNLPQLSPGEVETLRAWINDGARETPASAPAKRLWQAPLALQRPTVPAITWPAWSSPVERFVASYLKEHGAAAEPSLVSDATFARRAYLDAWGLLPPPTELRAFVADRDPGKRMLLVNRLLADAGRYSEHWISFWNDLLRNDEGINYYSETSSRTSITTWLSSALTANTPYNQMVAQLVNPMAPGDPEGFVIGVNWRGVVNASMTPAMQAAQNSAQIFIGLNLACNSCHDSFISKWKLKDAYALASFFSEDGRLQLYRCDVAQDAYATPSFLFPELNHAPASSSLADRRRAAAAIFTDPRNGRMPRTIVNRMWHRLLGRGLVENPDDLDGEPWQPALLDWLASDFVDRGYDIKQLIATIMTSRAYQLPAVPRVGPQPKTYTFRGPEIRRLSAEQFADAVATITGDWNVYQPPAPAPGAALPPGRYAREWRVAANPLTRALGRPIRDQVFSTRETTATTLQGLELVNGDRLTRWLLRGARRLTAELPPPPAAIFIAPINGRGDRLGSPNPRPVVTTAFDVDVSKARRLWLIVQDANSTALDKAEAVWADAQLVAADGSVTALNALQPVEQAALRNAPGPINLDGTELPGVRVRMPSVLVYDISNRGFTRFSGKAGLEHLENLSLGETLLGRFAIFETEPNMDRLIPPAPETPLPPPPAIATRREAVDWVFGYALGRPPSADERSVAEAALSDPNRPGRVSIEALADLLWAVLMKPEFQLMY